MSEVDRRKVVFVAPRFHTNQVGVVRAFLERGHRVEFHALLVGPTEDHSLLVPRIIPEAVLSRWLTRILGHGGANRRRSFPNPIAYCRLLRRLRPDTVIIRDPGRGFSIIAAICARLTGARIVFYDQAPLHRSYSPLRRLATGLVLAVFNAAWCTPLIGRDTSQRPPRHAYFLPFVVEASPAERPPRAEPSLLMVSKYQPRKNHLLLVEALAELRKDYRFGAVLVGECATAEQSEIFSRVADAIDACGMQSDIVQRVNVPFGAMEEFYRAADLFVLPASREPASISVLEAIANGTPAICSDTCGTQDYIQEGVNGFIFKSDDRADLARVLRLCLADAPRLYAMRSFCLRWAHEEISGSPYYQRFSAMMADRWPGEAGRW